MKKIIMAMLFASAWVLLPQIVSAANTRHLAIVVGNNHGLADDLDLRYAASDAEKIAKVLVDLADFDVNDVHLITNGKADDLQRLFAKINRGESAPGEVPISLIFFYYSGHSDGINLHMQGTMLPFADLRKLLVSTKAQISIALMDSCKSGALTRAKGATLGPAYAIEFLKDPEVEGRIVITSSSEDEISQESDKIEGSFFTHHWVSGLYGSADTNADEIVTLEEAYRYAHYRTVEETIASRGGVQHPSYNFALTGQGNVVLARLAHSTANITIKSNTATGEYYISDAQKQLVLTEVAATASGTTRIRLPPGHYSVRKREPGRLLVAQVEAKQNVTTMIADAQMTTIPYLKDKAKGEMPLALTLMHGPFFAVGFRNGITNEMDRTTEMRMGYKVGLNYFFIEPRFAYRRAELTSGYRDFAHKEYDFGLALGVQFVFDRLILATAIDGGIVLFDQEEINKMAASPVGPVVEEPLPVGAIPLGLQGELLAKADYSLSEKISAGAYSYFGVARFKQDNKNKNVIVIGAGVSVALSL